jgi:hypothetical protein
LVFESFLELLEGWLLGWRRRGYSKTGIPIGLEEGSVEEGLRRSLIHL